MIDEDDRRIAHLVAELQIAYDERDQWRIRAWVILFALIAIGSVQLLLS